MLRKVRACHPIPKACSFAEETVLEVVAEVRWGEEDGLGLGRVVDLNLRALQTHHPEIMELSHKLDIFSVRLRGRDGWPSCGDLGRRVRVTLAVRRPTMPVTLTTNGQTANCASSLYTTPRVIVEDRFIY